MTTIYSNSPVKPVGGWHRFVSALPQRTEPLAHHPDSPLKALACHVEGGQAWAVIEGREDDTAPEFTIAVLTGEVRSMMLRLPAQFRVVLADADEGTSVEVAIGGRCVAVNKGRRVTHPAQARMAFKAAHRKASETNLNKKPRGPAVRTSTGDGRAEAHTPSLASTTATYPGNWPASPYLSKEPSP